jgi:hypothetical protein
MAATGAGYDYVKWGGPDGIRVPVEVQKCCLVVYKQLDLTATTVDLTLDSNQQGASYVTVTGASSGLNVIFPFCHAGRLITVNNINASAAAVTFKVTGKSGIAIAANKKAILMFDDIGGDLIRITPDTT